VCGRLLPQLQPVNELQLPKMRERRHLDAEVVGLYRRKQAAPSLGGAISRFNTSKFGATVLLPNIYDRENMRTGRTSQVAAAAESTVVFIVLFYGSWMSIIFIQIILILLTSSPSDCCLFATVSISDVCIFTLMLYIISIDYDGFVCVCVCM
jgi:hypothetical protein